MVSLAGPVYWKTRRPRGQIRWLWAAGPVLTTCLFPRTYNTLPGIFLCLSTVIYVKISFPQLLQNNSTQLFLFLFFFRWSIEQYVLGDEMNFVVWPGSTKKVDTILQNCTTYTHVLLCFSVMVRSHLHFTQLSRLCGNCVNYFLHCGYNSCTNRKCECARLVQYNPLLNH